MIFPANITLDDKQRALVYKLQILENDLNPSFIKKILKKTPVGLYIHGSVGCGKSMVSYTFYESLKCKKLFIHYQDFMQNIHKALHSYKNKHNIIEKLANEYSAKAQILCIDEFEIKDITDAMMIGRLFQALKKQNVFILVTSNTAPKDLYKDGLQRELFIPFIDMISSEFDIFCFDDAIDYRMTKISSSKKLLYPLNEDTKQEMARIINHLTDIDHYKTSVLTVFGRKIEFKKTYKNTLVTNFVEICKASFSYNDYIEICNCFSTIIMEDVPIMNQDNTDEAIRFINFIDNIYAHNNLLFISLNSSPETIYQGNARALEFKRTISRLREIESDSYFNKAKK